MTTDGGSPAPTQSTSFRSAAAAGSVWGAAQLLTAKVAATISTFAFAYLLDPDALGIGASGLAVVSLLMVFPPAVLSDVLIRFGNDLYEWIGAGRRLARLVAFASLVLIMTAAAVISMLPDRQTLALIVAVLGFRIFFESLSSTRLSRLRVGLRFQTIAGVETLTALTVMASGIIYAWATRRPEAVVIGFVAGALMRFIAFTVATGPLTLPEHPKGDFTRLFQDFRHACLGHYAFSIYLVVDRLILTLLCSERVIGIYYFAFTLSAQINVALGVTLAVVIQPILGHLRDEPVRQLRAFRMVNAALATVAIPIMMAQAAVARLFFEIALPAKYADAAPILEVLSFASCFWCCMGPSLAMLTAQSRFREYLMFQVGQLVLLAVLVAAGASLGGEPHAGLYTAFGVTIQCAVSGPVALWLAGQRPDLPKSDRLRFGSCVGIFFRPLLGAAVAFAPTAFVANADLGLSRIPHVLASLLAMLASSAIYLLILRTFAPGTWNNLKTEALALLRRVRRSSPATVNDIPA